MTMERLPSPDGMVRWVGLLGPARQLAEVIAGTEFVPKAMRGKPDVVAAAIMYGDELGIGPMQALQSLSVIEGSPHPSAELMRALVFRDGHSLAVHEMTGMRCRVSGLRKDRPEAERVTVEWTIDMAKAAGLLGKPNWRSYPRAMLLARAMSDLARVLFPDVIKGMSYVADDAGSAADLDVWQAGPGEPPPAAEPERPRRVVQRQTPALAPTVGRHVADVPLPETPPDRPGSTTGGRHKDAPEPPSVAPDTPEAPVPPEPPAGGDVPLIDGRQLTALHTLLTQILGRATSNEQRRMVLADLVGRPLSSSRDLTREEGDVVRVHLNRVTSGTADLVFNETRGVWWVEPMPAAEPPPSPSGPPPDDVWRYDPETGEILGEGGPS
jgi:hypothetical protein